MKFRSIFPALLFLTASVSAEVPSTLAHQGRIAEGGVNYDGTGQFRFLLFLDSDGDQNSGNESALWSNASTAPADMNQPSSVVSVPVAKGLYAVWLGDTSLPNMAALPASLEPAAGQSLYLRTWFSNGVDPVEVLSPDAAIGSVPFALHAGSLPDGAVTEEMLSFPVAGGYARDPLVLTGRTRTYDLSGSVWGGFIEFPSNFDNAPICVATIDESITFNGATWARQERPARANEVAFRVNALADRLHWFAIEEGVHTISGKTIMAGRSTGVGTSSTISFPQSFATTPVILLMPSVPTGSGGSQVRLIGSPTIDGFQVWNNGTMDLHWIAMEPGQYEHGRFSWAAGVELAPAGVFPTFSLPVGFNTTEQVPVVIATILDTNNSGGTWIRSQDNDPQSLLFRLDNPVEGIHWLAVLEDR